MDEAAALSESQLPLASTQLGHGESYVLGLAALPSSYAAWASAPSHSIDLIDKTSLRLIQSLSGHDVATTSLRAVDSILGIPGRTLVSTGKDGSVKIWDHRSGSHSIKLTNLGNTSLGLLSCDVSPAGDLVAAGTEFQGQDSFIFYWDPRQPAVPVRSHSSTHSDDITTLSFHPFASSPPLLLSGSTDGLLSISNAIEDDEDETVMHVCSWGPSVSQAGWYRSDGTASGVWAASDMETFSLWSDQLDQRLSRDIRSPTLHTASRTWATDYLISCYPSNIGAIRLYTGSNEGDVALISSLSLDPNIDTLGKWTLHSSWTGKHIGVVRSILPDEENKVILTGGEDGRINLWKDYSSLLLPLSTNDTLMVNALDTDDDVHMDTSHDHRQSPIPWNRRKRDREDSEELAGKKPRVW